MKFTKIAMWSLLVAMVSPLTSQAVDYDLSNAVRVMRGTATDINGATVAVVGNTAYSIASDKKVRSWTLVDDNGTACTTESFATYVPYNPTTAIANDDSNNLAYVSGVDATPNTWRWINCRTTTTIKDGSTTYASNRVNLANAGGYTTTANTANVGKALRINGSLASGTASSWYCPSGQKVIHEVVSSSLGQTTINTYATGLTHNNGEYASAYRYDTNKILLTTASGIYDCTLSGSGASGTMTTTKISVQYKDASNN
ncbi:MAG: hypothetical protein J6Y87_04610, partial [Muribaculaceae bacterium]|nr:hypothetical protein [Muribaculaceae bacterium]